MTKVENLLAEIHQEILSASSQYAPMHSAHEGFALLYEEVDELWDEVKIKQSKRNLTNLRKEAIQVAAMATRFVYDICDGERYNV